MGKEPIYRQAMHHAWQMLWHHKLLWPFGIFATFLGQLGLVEFVTKYINALQERDSAQSWGNLPHMLSSAMSVFTQVQLPLDKWVWAVWMWVILIGICVVLLYAAIISQGTLIYATSQKIRTGKHPDISEAWHKSVGHFASLFTVHIVRKIIIIALTVLIGVATISAVQNTSPIGILALIVILLASITVGFILSCLAIYTVGYIVVEGQKLSQAVRGAWQLFTDHLLVSFEIGLLVVLGNVIVAILALVGAAVFLSPIFIVWFFAGIFTDAYFWILAAGSGALFFLVYIITLGSFFTIFSTSLWTYLFMKMHKHGIQSRFVHHIAEFLKFKSKA